MIYKKYFKIFIIYFIGILILTTFHQSTFGLNETVYYQQKDIEQSTSFSNYNSDDFLILEKSLGCIYEEVKQEDELPLFYYPPSWNWKDRGVMTSVKNQGGCGSCVAFGVLGAFEAVIRINGGPNLDLSESDLFYCGGGSCDNGWYSSSAVNYLYNNGVPDENCFPYRAYDIECDPCEDRIDRIKIPSDYGYLNSESSIKSAIYNYGPVITSFAVYEDFHTEYSSGIYQYTHGILDGYHCVTVVGYDDMNKYWICKNSWGSSWGESGYFRIGYGEPNVPSNPNAAICQSAYYLEYDGSFFVDPGGPYSGTTNKPIIFEGDAYGGEHPYTWSWDFGDGFYSDIQNPDHTYSSIGEYSVTLTVIDNNNNIETGSTSVKIANLPFIPIKPVGPTIGYPKISYNYSTLADDPNDANVRYGWDWDGNGIVDEWTDYYPPDSIVNISHSFNTIGKYDVQVLAKNSLGARSNFSPVLNVYISEINTKPNKPENPIPQNNSINVPLDMGLSWSCSDPDNGDSLSYDIYFGNVFPPKISIFNLTSNEYSPENLRPGTTYYWRIKAWDTFSNYSLSNIWQFKTEGEPNLPPIKPVINGPISGEADSTYRYSLVSIDPDSDQLSYYIDWGDNTITNWTCLYDSNEEVGVTHTWTSDGNFIIKAKVKDSYDESDWSIFEVSMPKNQRFINNFLFKFLFENSFLYNFFFNYFII